VTFTDEELVDQALAADPDAPLDPAAVSLWSLVEPTSAVLPEWYMPAAMAGAGSRWRRRVAMALIVTFVLIYAAGLCSTYGYLSPA
jgi:hypothetical protein